MPAPNPNLGGAPHHDNDIQDLWYALEELGFTVGVIAQTDYNFLNGNTLPADGEISAIVRAPGGDSIQGQAISSGMWSLTVRWLDEDENVVREQGISNNTEADTWASFQLSAKSPFVEVVVEDESGTEQTASLTVHYI